MGDHRSGLIGKFSILLIVNIEARYVRWQEVRCELNPLEGTTHAACEGFGQQGLAESGDILQQDIEF